MAKPPNFPHQSKPAAASGSTDNQSEDVNFLELAQVFRQVLDNDPEAFEATYRAFGVKRRMAYHLATIDRQFEGLELDEARLLKLGWTKLMVIGGHVNADNLEALLTLAEQHSVHELRLLMRNEPISPHTRCIILYLQPEEYAVFRGVLLKHGATPAGSHLLKTKEALLAALKQLQ